MTEYPGIGSPLFYGVFFAAVLVMIALDMFSLKKNSSHKVGVKEALAWSGLWVAVSCLFAGWLYFKLAGNPGYGAAVAKEKYWNSLPATFWKNRWQSTIFSCS